MFYATIISRKFNPEFIEKTFCRVDLSLQAHPILSLGANLNGFVLTPTDFLVLASLLSLFRSTSTIVCNKGEHKMRLRKLELLAPNHAPALKNAVIGTPLVMFFEIQKI